MPPPTRGRVNDGGVSNGFCPGTGAVGGTTDGRAGIGADVDVGATRVGVTSFPLSEHATSRAAIHNANRSIIAARAGVARFISDYLQERGIIGRPSFDRLRNRAAPLTPHLRQRLLDSLQRLVNVLWTSYMTLATLQIASVDVDEQISPRLLW